jgi:outer membrane protein assembly factor BamB
VAKAASAAFAARPRVHKESIVARFLSILAALLVAGASQAGAPLPPACSDGSCFPGGGKEATDCFAELEDVHPNTPYPVPGAAKVKPKKEQRCYDGDAGCDLDGEVNGVCRFPVDVCLFQTDPNVPGCTPAAVSAVKVKAKKSADGGAALQAAIDALLPASAAACTDGVTVEVPLKVTGAGVQKSRKVTVNVKATTSSGKDPDKLAFTCLPRLWPTGMYDHYNRRATAQSEITPANAASLVEKWTFDTPGGVTSTPTVGEKLVYATSWDGVVYALDRKKGTLKWSYDTGSASSGGLQSGATLTPDGRLVVGDSAAMVHALDAAKGTVLWTRSVEILPQDHIWGSPTVVNNRVFVPVASDDDTPCTKGRVEALDLDSGEPIWTTRTAPDRICEDDSTLGCMTDAGCPSGRCVGMCSDDRGIPCVDDTECAGAGECQDAIGGGVTATPSTDPTGETMFMASVGCLSGPRVGNADRIFRVRASDGLIDWALPNFPPEAFGEGPFNDYGFLNGPIFVNGATPIVVAASKDGKIYARDAGNGAEVFTETVGDVTLAVDAFAGFGLFNGPPALAAGRLFTSLNQYFDGTPDPIVHTKAFDIENGDPVWDASLDIGVTWGAVSAVNEVVFVGKGNIFIVPDPALYAFSASDGSLIATFPLPAQSTSGPSAVGSELFVGFGVLGPTGGVRAYELP